MFQSAAYLLGILFAAASLSVHADTFLKYKRTTDAYTVAGKSVPEATLEATAWIGDNDGREAVFPEQ